MTVTKRFAAATLVSILVVMTAGAFRVARADDPAPADTGATSQPAAETQPEPDANAKDLAVAAAVRGGLLRVQLEVQYDKGEPPYGLGWPFASLADPSVEKSLQEKRPIEAPAFLLSPTRAIVPDMVLHSRFIKSLSVRFGDQVVGAKIVAVAKRRSAIFIELDKPLTGATPLVFDAESAGPYKTVAYDRQSAYWTVSVGSLGGDLMTREGRGAYRVVPVGILIVDAKGTPVGVSMDSDLAADDSWKGSPLEWPTWSAKEIGEMIGTCEASTDKTVVRVELSLRSPKKRPGTRDRSAQGPTVHNVLGLMIDDRRVLVLGSMEPQLTARLERIRVYGTADDAIEAKFLHSLRDYGALLVELETPLPGGNRFSNLLAHEQLDQIMPAVEIKLRGEKRVPYFLRTRIINVRRGWLDRIYPDLASEQGNVFLFDRDGRLLATAMVLRPRPGGPDARGIFTGVDLIKDILADLPANIDSGNVPLSETQEDKVAWLGVLMQPLDAELARINKVSELTGDGRTGGLVSYVYPGSPADNVGIKTGDVLLRVRVPDSTRPVDIKVAEYLFARQPFPWEILDRIPEHRYDEIPTPWPPLETPLNRILTDAGIGNTVTFEVFDGSKVVEKPVKVQWSPPDYLTAPRYKDAQFGLTVADMTFEVRRYFQKTDKDPGVIVAKIDPGSRASIAGLKPFEIITHVNDRPVNNVKDFEQAVTDQKELRLEVKRMTRGRVVKLTVEASAPAPQTAPGDPSSIYAPRTPGEKVSASAALISRCRCARMNLSVAAAR